MSIPTITAVAAGDDHIRDDAYNAGIDDAHDEHTAGLTVTELAVRLDWTLRYADTPDAISYALGYGATIAALRLAALLTGQYQ